MTGGGIGRKDRVSNCSLSIGTVYVALFGGSHWWYLHQAKLLTLLLEYFPFL